MAILEHEVRSSSGSIVTGLHRHLFTRDEYYAIGAVGVFGEAHVELIEGQIIDKPTVSTAHAAINNPLAFLLQDTIAPGSAIQTQAHV